MRSKFVGLIMMALGAVLGCGIKSLPRPPPTAERDSPPPSSAAFPNPDAGCPVGVDCPSGTQ